MGSKSIRKRGLILLGSGLLAATLAFAPGAAGAGTAAWAAPQSTAPPEYVALGDSYAVGLDLGTVVGTIPGCGQTAASYPRQLALALGLDLTDVTCSGATTANILTVPQVTTNGTNPIQLDALSASTDIVTVTIGGNDLGFAGIIQKCLAGSETGPLLFTPTLDNCKSHYTQGGSDSLAAAVAGPVTSSLVDTLAKIRLLAPNAKVFVVGYPALMPGLTHVPPTGCFTPFASAPYTFPFTGIDVAYLHGIQVQLDTAMSTTADAAGATFVPTLAPTLANSPCANNVHTVVNGVSLTPGAMHPNTSGARLMSDQTTTAIQAVLAAPTISPTATSFSLRAGTPASLSFTAEGFPQPKLTTTGQLPAGLSFDSTTGILSGTPTAPGTSTFSLTATNGVGSVTEPYTVLVDQTPVITSAAPPGAATVGTSYSFTVTASGFPTPTMAVTGKLPDGLQFDPATGKISGTPTAAGSFSFGVSATNSAGTATSPAYSIQVAPKSVAPVITSGNPPAATLGSKYSFTVKATGYPTPTLALTGKLPDGLQFDPATGKISGTPTAAGTFSFGVTATNSAGSATSPSYSIEVKPADIAPVITSANPPAATLGSKYSFTVKATGTPAPTFAVSSGTLPKGLTLDPATGKISGTPTAAGQFKFTIAASNNVGPAATVQFTITVANSAVEPPTPAKPEKVTPGTSPKPNLATTGAGSLLPLGIGGGIALLAGAGLLLTRRTAKR